MATSSGCFRTVECQPPLPRLASSRHRASAHPRHRCLGVQCLGGRYAVYGTDVLRLGGRGAAGGHADGLLCLKPEGAPFLRLPLFTELPTRLILGNPYSPSRMLMR